MKLYVVLSLCLSFIGTGCASTNGRAGSSSYELNQDVANDAGRAQLVVVLLIDQLGSWVLKRYLPYLPKNGAFHYARRRGRVAYLHAGTFTAPGHAATFTGAPPAHSGVIANLVWNRRTHSLQNVVNQHQHPWLSDPKRFSSPKVLMVPTVGDALFAASGGRSQIVSLSFKDYAAVLAGGRNANLVLWFDSNKVHPEFTTSDYYMNELPQWLVTWQEQHPAKDYLDIWQVQDPTLAQTVNGPDDAPSEDSWDGFGRTFPHDPKNAQNPYEALIATPRGVDYLLDLALASIENLELGVDKAADFLAISISSPDVISHHFGAESWEYFELLRYIDMRLMVFIKELEKRGPVAFMLTSDHGIAPTPEKQTEDDRKGRINPRALQGRLERGLDAALGERDWIAAFQPPYIYFNDDVRQGGLRDRAAKTVLRILEKDPSIEQVFDVRKIYGSRDENSLIEYAVALSIPEHTDADIYVLPKYGRVFNDAEGAVGSNHGTPWDYDRDVPVVMWGPGIWSIHTTERMDQRRVPATMAEMLHIPAPWYVQKPPLEGAR
ncbi:MAG: alkaline phosphatase family protein [Myxococcales bacterium]|nr:MAG: alkaline phosphatase family protein [Myxococcales bacterium]